MNGKPEDRRWLIWSIEHNAWWRPNSYGYTNLRSEAGRYEYHDALAIIADANAYMKSRPNEALVPDQLWED